ncbi:Gamma-interferon-responsive lysosomal thiol protein, partial [Linum grandiflorum]
HHHHQLLRYCIYFLCFQWIIIKLQAFCYLHSWLLSKEQEEEKPNKTMASSPFLLLLLASLPFLLFSPTQSHEPDPDDGFFDQKDESDRVNLTLYYETRCPYCRDFIVDPLAKAVATDLMNIVNLRLVPWGNAYIDGPRVVCQHGADECYLNTIHACILAIAKPRFQFEFIKCTEKESSSEMSNPSFAWRTCANDLQFPQMLIEGCYYNGMGKKLLLKYGDETMHLKPPVQGVPWVTVNGVPLNQDFDKFVSYVCKAYRGKSLPNACRMHSFDNEKKRTAQPICYRT